MSTPNSDETPTPQGFYEGLWTRLRCESCESLFDVEGDVSNGEIHMCDACGTDVEVIGR